MRLAAVVAAAAAVVNLLLLGLLHVVSPEVDPVTRPVSEYALEEFGWLATARTLAEGVGMIALAVALLLERAVGLRLERNAVGGFGLAQRAYLALSALWQLLAALALLRNRRSQAA
jgi:hypothetical protein